MEETEAQGRFFLSTGGGPAGESGCLFYPQDPLSFSHHAVPSLWMLRGLHPRIPCPAPG